MSDQFYDLTSDPNQTMTINPVVDGNTLSLQLDIAWNDIAGYWTMRVTDLTANSVLLEGIPLIAGRYPAANLLGQYGYLAIGSAYLVNISSSNSDYPTEDNLGDDFCLVWSDTAS